jgi:hypothetical protein
VVPKAIASLLLASLVVVSQANAGDFTEILGVDRSIDHAAADFQALLDEARESGFALEAQANEDGKERIEQINKLVENAISDIKATEGKTIDDISAVLDKYIKKFQDMKDESFQQLSNEIAQIDCTAQKVTLQDLPEFLGGFGRVVLHTNSFILTPPPLYEGEQVCDTLHLDCQPVERRFYIDPSNPAETEKELRHYMEDRLSQSTDNTPISSILISYNIIAQSANRTGCLTNLHEAYAAIAEPYMAKIQLWERVTGENTVPIAK